LRDLASSAITAQFDQNGEAIEWWLRADGNEKAFVSHNLINERNAVARHLRPHPHGMKGAGAADFGLVARLRECR